MTLKTFSFGGGVQSTAALVLAAQGRIDYRTFVFSDVGDDSEHPATFEYMSRYAAPFAASHGLELVTVRAMRGGEPETVMGRLLTQSHRMPAIPMRLGRSGMPAKRLCTYDFKIVPVSKWVKAQGATAENPGVLGLGISLDEINRMRTGKIFPYLDRDYPLIDLRLTRTDCEHIIRDAGLPVPPKSSCFFCPYHSIRTWQRLYDTDRALFNKSAELERTINVRRREQGHDPMWLTDALMPLDQVVTGFHQNQLGLFTEVDGERHSCGPFVCSGGAA